MEAGKVSEKVTRPSKQSEAVIPAVILRGRCFQSSRNTMSLHSLGVGGSGRDTGYSEYFSEPPLAGKPLPVTHISSKHVPVLVSRAPATDSPTQPTLSLFLSLLILTRGARRKAGMIIFLVMSAQYLELKVNKREKKNEGRRIEERKNKNICILDCLLYM